LGRIAEFIPTNLSIHWNQFALFSRFLPFSPISFQMLIFKCHKKGQKSNNLLFFPVTENQGEFSKKLEELEEVIEAKEIGKTFCRRERPRP